MTPVETTTSASAVIHQAPPKPLTAWQALRQIGVYTPSDALFLIMIGFTWITVGYWAIFGKPTEIGIIGVVIGTMAIIGLWIVILLFRTMRLVAETRAAVELITSDSARLTVAYLKSASNQA